MAIMTVIIDHKAPTGKECALSTNYRLLCNIIKEYECDKVQNQDVVSKRSGGSYGKIPKATKHLTKVCVLLEIPLEVTNASFINNTVSTTSSAHVLAV